MSKKKSARAEGAVERIDSKRVGLSAAHGALSSGILSVEGMPDVMRGGWKGFDSMPDDVTEAQAQAREWLNEKSIFLQTGLDLKISFANWGYQIDGVERLDAGDRKKLREWRSKNDQVIFPFVRQTWEDWYLLNCAASFWRRGAGGGERGAGKGRGAGTGPKLLTLAPEKCRFKDKMGIERLWYRPELSAEDIRSLPENLKKRYSQREVELLEENGEFFRVLKLARVGDGFGMPRLVSLFRTLKTGESMEVADNLWGYISRLCLRQIKVGHEIKNGAHAGKPIHFITKKKSDAVQKFLEGRMGAADWATNFDFEVVFPFPSLDRFDKSKYEGVYQRMAMWLGPLGLLMGGQPLAAVVPVLMDMLKAKVADDRLWVGMYCSEVINTVFRPPVPVKVCWNDKIFMDTRMAMELVKFLLSQGALSQRTALGYAGENVEEEREFKSEEGELAQNDSTKYQVLPIYDPAHGLVGEEPPGQPGRLAGGKNGK